MAVQGFLGIHHRLGVPRDDACEHRLDFAALDQCFDGRGGVSTAHRAFGMFVHLHGQHTYPIFLLFGVLLR